MPPRKKKEDVDETEGLTEGKLLAFTDQFAAIERQLNGALTSVKRMKDILKEKQRERIRSKQKEQ